MSARYAIYANATGRIRLLMRTESAERAQQQCADDESIAEIGANARTVDTYIDPITGQATVRTASPAVVDTASVPADGATAVTLNDLAPGTEITVSGPAQDRFTVADDACALTFTWPGRYIVTVAAPFPARPIEQVIDAT